MEFFAVFALLIVLALLLGGLAFRHNRGIAAPPAQPQAKPQDSEYKVSFAPPEFEWSGHSSGQLPLKMLTYKQYECLEDARYGFKIVALPPSEREQLQPHKTRAHGLKTVASLAKHGFLVEDSHGGYAITDVGLNALEVCSVRY